MAMRITNSMITMHSKTNINGTKNLTDKYNGQMTSQKKIDKPSDDPVVAIRSLRLRDSLHEVEQYTDKNIPDAESWLKVTETSLNNVSNILKDIYGMCVNGSTGTLTNDDRNVIMSNLSAYVEQIYSEGNTEYAGRTIFTGYKTNKTLTFEEATDADYNIRQKFDTQNTITKTFYTGKVEVPKTEAEILSSVISDIVDTSYDVVKFAYSDIDKVNKVSFKIGNAAPEECDVTGTAVTDPSSGVTYSSANLTTTTLMTPTNVYTFDNEEDWAAVMGKKEVGDDDIVIIKATGEMVLGSNVGATLKQNKAEIALDYDKTSFVKGEVRPEMLFDCTDSTNPIAPIEYEREVQDINYLVAGNQLLNVNTQAGQDGVFSTMIKRDVEDLINAVTRAQAANEDKARIEAMMKNPLYASEDDQAKLKDWLNAINKEVTYTTDNLQKLFSQGITRFQDYKQTVDLAKTDVGSKAKRLELTKTRVTSQKSSLQELIHSNEDRELSDILIDYETANLAYQSSLKAASEINQMTLLTYL